MKLPCRCCGKTGVRVYLEEALQIYADGRLRGGLFTAGSENTAVHRGAVDEAGAEKYCALRKGPCP